MATYEFISMHEEHGEDVLTLLKRPNWLMRLFGAKAEEVKFFGLCTVWYEYETCRRCDTLMECMLSDFAMYAKRKQRRVKQ